MVNDQHLSFAVDKVLGLLDVETHHDQPLPPSFGCRAGSIIGIILPIKKLSR